MKFGLTYKMCECINSFISNKRFHFDSQSNVVFNITFQGPQSALRPALLEVDQLGSAVSRFHAVYTATLPSQVCGRSFE